MLDSCVICGSFEQIQGHHISYNPEIKVPLCRKCHAGEHHHGTGNCYRPKPKVEVPLVFIGIKIPIKLLKVSKLYMKAAGYENMSEFVRQGIRELIKKDTPQLLKEDAEWRR